MDCCMPWSGLFRSRYTKSKAFLALCIYGFLCRIQEPAVFTAGSWMRRPANQLFRRSYKEQLNSNVAISIHLVTAPYVDQFYKLVIVFVTVAWQIGTN